MARFWKKVTGSHEPDPQAVAQLKSSEERLEQARSLSDDIAALSSYLAERRQENHFGEALNITFTPRNRHA